MCTPRTIAISFDCYMPMQVKKGDTTKFLFGHLDMTELLAKVKTKRHD